MGKHLISYRLSTTYLVFRRLDQVWSGITNLCFWWFRQSQVSFMVRSFWIPVVCPDWCARFTMTFLEVDTCKETQKQTSKVVSPVPSISMHFLWKTFHLKPIETVVPCFNWECMRRPRTVLARLLLHRPFHTPVLSKPVPDCLARMDSEEKLGGLPLDDWNDLRLWF